MRPIFSSLRFRIVLSVIIPALITVGILTRSHYLREQRILQTELILTTTQLGKVTLGSIQHAVQTNNLEMATRIFSDVGRLDNISRIQLLDSDGRVMLDSLGLSTGDQLTKDEAGCIECHQLKNGEMPSAVKLPGSVSDLRVETTLRQQAECSDCDPEAAPVLGVLLMDVSMQAMQKHLRDDSMAAFIILFIGILVIAVGVYIFMDLFVVRRVDAIRRPLLEIAGGNLDTRIPVNSGMEDEITDLANAFNDMAVQLQRHVRKQEDLSKVRQEAIIEERERIARELHDGFAQIPVYVNTKASAARLMLEKGQYEMAKNHLSQLQEAAGELLFQVREAVISLRLSAQVGNGLKHSLQSYVEQLNRLGSLQVELQIAPEIDRLSLDSEVELQLFRIVQEALTNVRKHSEASQAAVDLRLIEGSLVVTVSDDGKGFDQERTRPRGVSGFGLKNMAERASSIQADLKFEQIPGSGTRITVTRRINLE